MAWESWMQKMQVFLTWGIVLEIHQWVARVFNPLDAIFMDIYQDQSPNDWRGEKLIANGISFHAILLIMKTIKVIGHGLGSHCQKLYAL